MCVAAVCAVGVLVGLVAWIVCGRMKRHLLLTTTGGYEDSLNRTRSMGGSRIFSGGVERI